MPLQMGTMMVVVRAQDFASRTLRRVGAEMEGLSRAEAMRMRGDMVAHQNRIAESYMRTAQANMQALETVRKYNQAMEKQAALGRQVAATQAKLDRLRGARGRAISAAHQELAMARQEFDFFRRLAKEVSAHPLRTSMRGQISSPERGMEQAARRMENAHNQLEKASRSLTRGMGLANLERQLASLTSQWQTASTTASKLGQAVSGMPGWLRAAATSASGFASAQEKANRELMNAQNNLSRAQQSQLAYNRAVEQLPVKKLERWGHALSGIGRTMQLVGLIGTAVFAGAANSFANFNKEVMLAATQMTDVDAGWKAVGVNAERLQAEIMDLTQTFPSSADEMAKSAYDIFSSMNVSFGGGIDLLKRFNQLSVATLTDLETATNAGITVLNNFGGTSKDINETLNLMVATVRFGRMRLEDFNTMLNKVAPAAASADQELRDVAGAMALITTRQPSQRQAATGIARLFQVFQDPDFQEGVRKASDGIVDIVKEGGGLKPLPIIINDLADAFKEVSTKKGAAQLFRELTAAGRGSGRGLRSTIEAQRAWTFLFKNLDEYNDLQDKVTGDSKEFARALKAMSKSPGVRWDVFINQMRTLILVIGEQAIPVFLAIGDTISNAVRWFKQLDEGTKGLIIRWGAWAAVGSLVAGVLLGIAGPILTVVAHFRLWKMAAGGAEAKLITISGLIRALPLIPIFLALKAFVGWERALKIMIIGWAAWKAAAIIAVAAVKAANIGAAMAVKVAWRSALLGTGVGVLVVAFGLAAEYIINHWDKVKTWFQIFFDWLVIEGYQTALMFIEPFTHLPRQAGQWARDLKTQFNTAIGGIRIGAHVRKETAESAKAMDLWLKNQPKKFRAARKALQKEILGAKPGSMLKETLQAEMKLYNAALKRRNKMKADADAEAFSEGFWKTFGAKTLEDYSKQLEELYKTQVDGAKEAGKWQKELNKVQADAATQAVDTLRNMYMEMQGVNEQMMGQLFQGPWLTGETFNLAEEWGITPRIQDIIRDLDGQIAQFKERRNMIDILFKRGLPQGFLDELKQMTPEEAMPILTELVNSTPKETKKLIGRLNNREKLIRDATKIDFTREITAFRKAGVNMGEAMINGFQEAGVGKWFDGWVKSKFPNLINAAVATAVKDWKASNPKPAGSKGKTPVDKSPGKSTSSKTTNDNSKNAHVTVNMQPPYPAQTPAQVKASQRHAAFIARSTAKGII